MQPVRLDSVMIAKIVRIVVRANLPGFMIVPFIVDWYEHKTEPVRHG